MPLEQRSFLIKREFENFGLVFGGFAGCLVANDEQPGTFTHIVGYARHLNVSDIIFFISYLFNFSFESFDNHPENKSAVCLR